MIKDTATPWIRHQLQKGSWICRRCGLELYSADFVNEKYEGEMFVKDGRMAVSIPFNKFLDC